MVPTLSGSYADLMTGHVNFSSNKHLSIYCVPDTALGLYSQGVWSLRRDPFLFNSLGIKQLVQNCERTCYFLVLLNTRSDPTCRCYLVVLDLATNAGWATSSGQHAAVLTPCPLAFGLGRENPLQLPIKRHDWSWTTDPFKGGSTCLIISLMYICFWFFCYCYQLLNVGLFSFQIAFGGNGSRLRTWEQLITISSEIRPFIISITFRETK